MLGDQGLLSGAATEGDQTMPRDPVKTTTLRLVPTSGTTPAPTSEAYAPNTVAAAFLAEFVLTRIDEDEESAQEPGVSDGPHRAAVRRTLLECESKRAIIEQALLIVERELLAHCDDPTGLRLISLTALPYADHPGYAAATLGALPHTVH